MYSNISMLYSSYSVGDFLVPVSVVVIMTAEKAGNILPAKVFDWLNEVSMPMYIFSGSMYQNRRGSVWKNCWHDSNNTAFGFLYFNNLACVKKEIDKIEE